MVYRPAGFVYIATRRSPTSFHSWSKPSRKYAFWFRDGDVWSRATRRASRIAQPLLFAVIATLLTVLVARPTIAQFTPFEAAIAEFGASVAAGVADDAAGCVSVAVFEGSRVIWSKGYGWADIERRIAATAETIGRTGSISKSFTAVLLLQLVERGILGLDDPVREHFPEIDRLQGSGDLSRPVTSRMLASHTAGLVREPALEGAASGSIYGWEDKILDAIPTHVVQDTAAHRILVLEHRVRHPGIGRITRGDGALHGAGGTTDSRTARHGEQRVRDQLARTAATVVGRLQQEP